MINSVLSIVFIFFAQAEAPAVSLSVTCDCSVYDSVSMTEIASDGMVSNNVISDRVSATIFGRVTGIQDNIKATEMLACSGDVFADIALSCPRPFAKALNNCRKQAQALYPDAAPGSESFSINPDTCYASAEYAKED